ncbi:hypothetical protein B0J13DRAFT_460701 [Dactylonectria estremocensis]|uniref:Uncharacterized protein n=1 Tax=Dactylonectria estremocensis TaxID=1079267 RepID=A0A9P9IAE0_9HYPO|nr:hypothetical protein B0J13DRAFT_460701 [Dactylonectria estremocensis]
MHFHTFFGRLGHKLNPRQRFKDPDNDEPLKEVCSNSRSSALWHFILFHLPAILVTTILLVLHAKNMRWDPSHPTNDELAALQFAAKAQESLILISLTDILLHRIRYGLLSKNGVPLGFLSSPFNISFSLQYLFSQEFWSAALSPSAKRLFNGATAGMILMLALLGLAAGPSSAIAMIPRYDWWQLSESASATLFGGSIPRGYAFVRGTPYPMELESANIRAPEDCHLYINQTCVNLNLDAILQSLTNTLMDSYTGLSSSTNVTVPSLPDGDYGHRPITFGNDYFSPTNDSKYRGDSAYATTPMDIVARQLNNDAVISQAPRILFRSQALMLAGKEKWKQPLVTAHCAPSYRFRTMNQTSATFPFGDRLYKNFTISLDFDDIDFLKDIPVNYGDELYHRTVISVLDIQHLLRVPITASILFASSLELFPWMDMVLCLIQARWVEADVWLHPVESAEVQSHLGFPTNDTMQYIRQKSDPKDVIKMTIKWLRDIRVPQNSVSTPGENPAYQQGYDFCVNYYEAQLPLVDLSYLGSRTGPCLPAFLAVYLAEALSQSTAVLDVPTSPSPGPNSTVIFNTYFEHVYAYGFGESTTIQLAFTTLLLQVFIALIHLALIMFVRQPWHCSAWGSFGQLLTLALQSNKSDELSSTGARVSRSRTWKLITRVREVGEGRQLEMAVGVPTAMPRRGQTNRDVEERGATQMRIP